MTPDSAVDPRGHQSIVDVGCGIGGTLAALLRVAPALRLTGLDVSAAELAQARAHLPASVALAQADANHRLPLLDRSVDAVVCHNVVELLTRPAQFLSEVYRVLRPGGTAVVAHTDFATIVAHPIDPGLHQQIIIAYTEHQQPWMAHHDGYAARKLPGLVNASPLKLVDVDAHVDVTTDPDSVVAARLDEIATALSGYPAIPQVDVDAWRHGLKPTSQSGEFLYAETTYLALATKSLA